MENHSNTERKFDFDNIKTAAALVAANFFYGTNIIAVKQISPHLISPLGLSFSRIFFTGLVLILMGWMGKGKQPIERKDYPLLILAGLLGITMNQTFSIMGIAATNPIHSSLLIMSTPIIVTVMAALFLKEKFGAHKLFGLLLGMAGALLLIISKGASTSNPPTLKGDLFVLSGSLCYSTYLILIRKLSLKYSPITILRFAFSFGAFFSIPIGLYDFTNASWNGFEGWQWFSWVYIILMGTLAANLMMNWGVKKWGPSRTGNFVYFQPLFGTLGAILLMGEQLTPSKMAAGSLIILGVWLATMKK